MRRLMFAIVLCGAASGVAAAQRVPGRDLLEFPIGLLAEAPALSTLAGDGLRTPTSVLLGPAVRARLTVLSLVTGAEQGVSAQAASVAVRVPNRVTLGLSVLRAAVTDLLRTETDPQSIGEIPYSTTMISLVAARQHQPHLATALAVRYRVGELDTRRGGAVGLDGGVVVHGLTSRDVRIGVSSFLWRPAAADAEETTFSAAADARVAGGDSLAAMRLGYSFSRTEHFSREHFVSLAGRLRKWEGRAGVARTTAYGHTDTRLRLALGLHYARYLVAVAREDNAAGLSPTYQFQLSMVLP